MSWATSYIAKLQEGEICQFRPPGNSMTGAIESGQLVTVCPLGDEPIEVGDIVLCRVKESSFLHMIKAVEGNRYEIGTNQGVINGWIELPDIYGRVTAVE